MTMTKLRKLKKWIDGFRTIDYKVPLKEKCGYELIPYHLDSVSRDLLYYSFKRIPISKLSIGIKEYTVTKEFSPSIIADLINKEKSINFTNILYQSVFSDSEKEMCVLTTIYGLGLDREVWRIDITAYAMYRCRSNVYNNEIANIVINFINNFIANIKLDKMFLHPIRARKIDNFNSEKEKEYRSVLTTYFNECDYKKYGIDELLPKNAMNKFRDNEYIHKVNISHICDEYVPYTVMREK